MSAAYAQQLSGGAVEVRSDGSAPAESVNLAVRAAMLEEGIDISAEKPKLRTTDAAEAVVVVVIIIVGRGDSWPFIWASDIGIASWTTPLVRD